MGLAALLPQRAASPTGEADPPPSGAGYSGAMLWRLLTVLSQSATGERSLPLPTPPCNPVTGHAFRGFNRLALTAHQLSAGISDPRYVTFEQVSDLASAIGAPMAHVKQGSRQLLLLRPVGGSDGDPALDDEVTLDALLDAASASPADEESDGMRVSLDMGDSATRFGGRRRLRPYGVFHASQIAGLSPLPSLATPPRAPRAALLAFLSEGGIDPTALPVSRDASTSREAHLSALLDAGFRAHVRREAIDGLDSGALAIGASFAALLGSLALGVRRPVVSGADLPERDAVLRLPPPAQFALLRGAQAAYAFCDALQAHAQQVQTPTPVQAVGPTI